MLDLNSLPNAPKGIVLTDATAINDHNQIVTEGSDQHSYIIALDVPEPSSYVLVAVGLIGLGFWQRKIR